MRVRAAVTIWLALLVALGIGVLDAGPAAAGGPTSALLVAPATGRTASLYTTDADYQSLGELLGAAIAGTGTVDGTGTPHAAGESVTVTWLLHDVSVWRVDRIYLDARGGPWVATQTNVDGGDLMAAPVLWQAPARGAQLAALLERLGLTGTDPATAEPVAAEPVAAEPVAAEPVAPAGASTQGTTGDSGSSDSGDSGFSTAGWGLVGLLAGAALGAAAMRARSPRSPGSRDAGSDQPAQDRDVSCADVISS